MDFKNILNLSALFLKQAKGKWEQSIDSEGIEEAVEKGILLDKKYFSILWNKLSSKKYTFMHFGDVNKLGVKPTSVSANFRGVYGWDIYNKSFDDITPYVYSFFKGRELIHFFSVNEPEKLIHINSYSNLDKDIKKIIEMSPENKDSILNAYKNAKNTGATQFQQLEMIMEDAFADIDLPIIGERPIASKTFSTRFLKALGYIGIYWENVNVVVFSSSNITQVGTIPNPKKDS